VLSKEGEVLAALARIIDPDFGMNIVDCGFIKDLVVAGEAGAVSFRMELTTPACPIKDDFERMVSSLGISAVGSRPCRSR
jgi:metal-sulfur cluster biosynthetic enzyme